MTNPTCAVDGCSSPTKARGWCKQHYNRWHYSGTTAPAQTPAAECAHCGVLMERRKTPGGPPPKYCNRSCQSKASYLRNGGSVARSRSAVKAATAAKRAALIKTCPQCSTEFTPRKHSGQRFCSAPCGKKFAAAAERARRRSCSADGCENKEISRGLCRQHHPTAKAWSRNGNPETRRASLRRKTQQRRAKLKGDAGAELIDRDEIGRRDGWRCGLCLRRVDQELSYPHPQSASLDHILPLSLGGTHSRANVQISHLNCNVSKGNRSQGEQLLLIG